MKTSATQNPVNITQNLGLSSKTSYAAPEVPFKQVLSREIGERARVPESRPAETSKVSRQEAGAAAPQPQAPASNTGKTRQADAGNAKEPTESTQEEDNPAPSVAAAASAEIMALVNNLVQASAVATDAGVTAAATEGAALGIDAGGLKKIALIPGAGLPELPGKVKPENLGEAQDFAGKMRTASLGSGVQDKVRTTGLDPRAMPANTAPEAARGLANLAGAARATTAPNPAIQERQVKAQPANVAAPELSAAQDVALKPAAEIPANTTIPAAEAQQADTSKPFKLPDAQQGQAVLPPADLAAAKTQQTSAPQSTAAIGQIQQAGLAATQGAANQPTDKLSPRVGSPGWDQALGQKVTWMVAGGQQSASLTLNPPDLGPLQVVLNISNTQASASFTAAQPEVRQALEAALPRLREMLAEAGIQLGQTSVGAGTPNQYSSAGDQAQHNARHPGQFGNAADTPAIVARPVVQSSGLGLIDTFA